MSILKRFKRKQPDNHWDVVTWPWGGWNYPDPIIPDYDGSYAPDDPYLHHLLYMAGYGWHYYQKAFIGMQIIHPLALYRPLIHEEFRETFEASREDNGMPLLVYEREGKIISSTNWAAYWLYREREEPSIPCIILGHFQEDPSIAVCDRPFMRKRPDQILKAQYPLTDW